MVRSRIRPFGLLVVLMLTSILVTLSTGAGAQTPANSNVAANAAVKKSRKHKAANSNSAATATTTPADTSNCAAGMVWVNTVSGVYHNSNSRWFGKTKNGKCMSEEDAKKAGYKLAKTNH